MAQQQQTNQTVMYGTINKAGWPSGLRRQTQENFSLEISGTRMCAWVRIPLLSEIFQALRSISWNKNNAKPEAILLLKVKRYKDPTWELSIETFVTSECAWVQNLPL